MKLNDTQEELEETKKKVNALENRLMQFPGIYTWKISGFSEALVQSKSGKLAIIRSDPFYDHGYKFRLSLYPNGRSSGENSHLSITFILMKGEYDALLSWPFRKKVTYTLIDQQEDPNDRSNVIYSFTADPIKYKDSFSKPVTDENAKGFGLFTFMPQCDVKKRRYIVDDTMFIQVQIDPPE